MSEERCSVIGKPIPRVDGIEKVKGEPVYTTDLSLPGMLQGALLRSPYPHARILGIDTSKAEKVKGVQAVITGNDIPAVKYGFMMAAVPESGDQYLLARDKVRYIGDEVAAVAAVSEQAAQEALELIEVKYEILPPLLTIEEAMQPGAPLIHEGLPGNISAKSGMEFGDVEQGFRESDYIREDTFVTQIVQHCPMEPHISLAHFESSGKLTLWTSTQAPFIVQQLLPRVLGIPGGNVRVIKPYIGGGFGAKLEVFPLDLCAALLSRKSGKPVKIVYTREEEFAASRRRHPMEIKLKIGVKNDGKIMSRTATIMLDGGAYSSVGQAAAFLSTLFLSLPYQQANIKFESCRIYTNNTPSGAMRGYGAPQVLLASEVQMDMVAEVLGIDPMELRAKNGLRAGDTTLSGLKMTSGSLQECIQKIAVSSEWKKKYKKMPPFQGIGLASVGFLCGSSLPMLGPFTASSTIFIKANTDGTVVIISGVSDIGQGSDTVLCQITAEVLGLGMEDIKITLPDTDTSPPDMISASSRVTFMAGNAAKRAASDLKQKLLQAVAARLEANAEDLVAQDRRIYVKGSRERGVSFGEAVALCQMSHNGMTIVGEGSYTPDPGPLDIHKGSGNYSPAYTFGSVVAEVEVDRETGRVGVNKLSFCHDCGRVINLLGVEGQLEGSVSMGVGYAFYENLVVREGKTLTPGFLEYKLPTAMEIPEIDSIVVESNDPGGPFGAKESAEGTVAPIAPAILNAIYDATGVRFKELPVTPEKLLRELRKKEEAEQR